MQTLNRREFLLTCLGGTAAFSAAAEPAREIIDFHQHTPFGGRSLESLRAHQKRLGATWTVLHPAGRAAGLGAGCGSNAQVWEAVQKFPREFICFANESPEFSDVAEVIRRYVEQGARGIGEQKFALVCHGKAMDRIYQLARELNVPVLLHFEYGKYNLGFDRFGEVLKRYPDVTFIGHAQTWWDGVRPARGRRKGGGLTEKFLAKHPNLYGDLSGRSGVEFLERDRSFSRDFLERHQDRLLFGSDCPDPDGRDCWGARLLSLVEQLSPTEAVQGQILAGNARNILKIKAP